MSTEQFIKMYLAELEEQRKEEEKLGYVNDDLDNKFIAILQFERFVKIKKQEARKKKEAAKCATRKE